MDGGKGRKSVCGMSPRSSASLILTSLLWEGRTADTVARGKWDSCCQACYSPENSGGDKRGRAREWMKIFTQDEKIES
ncbi:hypothetical protein KIN20_019771 [Parelaphostrongylus tenuis]|uniref:Uncharacterized protein n=1 Tax=Parelaphostrongylus tenuis TaxID=148309 RepID=A0AAD5QT44_PARTN|nr:hypothetical protein KIN20_019771 [Parelaphostrongylus tenuis]